MRFAVPQFIDVEDKIFGPLTFRQFIYLVGGGGLVYLVIKLLPWYIGFLLALPIAGLSLALAFVKFNNKPFINIIESGFNYFLRDKLYIWRKEKSDAKEEKSENATTATPNYIPKLSQSKLHDISWGLDVLGREKNNKNQ